MKKKGKSKSKAGLRAGLVVALVMGMLFGYASFLMNVQVEYNPSWHIVWEGNFAEASEANPGAGAGGILEIFIYPHQANPGTVYAENNSATLESNAYGWANADDSEIDIPYDTAFDVVVRVRGNATQCKRGSTWYDSDLRVRITWSDKSLTDYVATGVVTQNNSADNFLWMNFYINNGGNGYTISKGSTSEIENIKFEAYY